MAGDKLIVVLGATGTQGGSVVQTLLSDKSWSIRGITRNASSAKSKALAAKGVHMVEADTSDISSLQKAFEGAHAIFSVTDFWVSYADVAMNPSKLNASQAMNEYALEAELQQGKNIFDAAARVPSLEKLIFSSISNVTKYSGGKYTKVMHFDSKAFAVEYGKEKYPELFAKTSLIELGLYLSNFCTDPRTKPQKNTETGTYDFVLVGESSGKIPFVAAEKDTGPLAAALLSAPAGKDLAAVREWLSMDEYVKLWSKALGVEGRLVVGNMDQLPPDLKQEFAEMIGFMAEFGYFGEKAGAPLTYPEDLDSTLNLGTVEEWIRDQDWSHVIQP